MLLSAFYVFVKAVRPDASTVVCILAMVFVFASRARNMNLARVMRSLTFSAFTQPARAATRSCHVCMIMTGTVADNRCSYRPKSP